MGFDHGAGHPLLFLDDAKAPNCQKNNGFNGLGNYSEWPKVAGAVIQAQMRDVHNPIATTLDHFELVIEAFHKPTCVPVNKVSRTLKVRGGIMSQANR